MNIFNKYIISAVCIGFTAWFLVPACETVNEDITPSSITTSNKENTPNATKVINKIVPLGEPLLRNIPEELSPEKLAQLNALQQKANELYLATLKKGGLDAPISVSYDDNWCDFNQDVMASDRQLIRKDLHQLDFERGRNINTAGMQQYYAPYKASSERELVQLAKSKDKLAMRILLQKLSVSDKLEQPLAVNLMVMGDTGRALFTKVLSSLYDIDVQHSKGVDNKALTKELIKVLAYVEYGLRRQDLNGLSAYTASYQSEKTTPLGQLMRDVANNPKIQKTISRLADKIEDTFNAQRAKINLPLLETNDISSLQTKVFEAEIANTMYFSPEEINKEIYPKAWSKSYLNADTPCVQRMLSYYKYLIEELPPLRRKANAILADS